MRVYVDKQGHVQHYDVAELLRRRVESVDNFRRAMVSVGAMGATTAEAMRRLIAVMQNKP